jgi:tRNA (mo5U34)-methyltransferase
MVGLRGPKCLAGVSRHFGGTMTRVKAGRTGVHTRRPVIELTGEPTGGKGESVPDADDESADIASLHSFHSLTLKDGREIRGGKSFEVMNFEYRNTFDPIGSLQGKSVLDIGAWSGAFSVEAARRGATKVTAVDRHVKPVFRPFVDQSGYRIDWFEIDMDQSPRALGALGVHDIVLFMGVFYHLRDPIAALREVAKVTGETLVLETLVELSLPPERPAMMFYPGREVNNDPSTWWGPNVQCVRDLLGMVGFSRVRDAPGSGPDRHIFHATR